MTYYHPAVKHVLDYFKYSHLPEHLQPTSKLFYDTAITYLQSLKDTNNPEVTVCLRKLLEAKDAAVRSSLPKESV